MGVSSVPSFSQKMTPTTMSLFLSERTCHGCSEQALRDARRMSV